MENMKIKLFSLLILVLSPYLGYSQINLLKGLGLDVSLYVDPATAGAVNGYSSQLKSGQNKVIDKQDKLQKAQLFIAAEMERINTIQGKIYKGLSEVSGTLSNGLQVNRILFTEIPECYDYIKEIKRLALRHPQYSVFASKAASRAYEEAAAIAAEVSSIIAEGEDKLATAGDRWIVLSSIEHKIQMFKLWLLAIKMSFESIEEAGFWRSVNPFQGYINTDKDIIQNIMDKFKQYQY
jgi:hypothetical protein